MPAVILVLPGDRLSSRPVLTSVPCKKKLSRAIKRRELKRRRRRRREKKEEEEEGGDGGAVDAVPLPTEDC